MLLCVSLYWTIGHCVTQRRRWTRTFIGTNLMNCINRVNLTNWTNWMNWMNWVNWTNRMNLENWMNWMSLINWMSWMSWMNWMNWVTGMNKINWMNWMNWINWANWMIDYWASELEGCPGYLVPLQIILNSEVSKNDCSGWNRLGRQVPGPLPDTGQPRLGIQVLPHSWLQLLLHPWLKGAGLGHPGQGQEETKPIHHEEKCQAQGGVSEQEAKPFTCASCQASPASTLTNCFIRASPGDLSEEGWNNAILLTAGW